MKSTLLGLVIFFMTIAGATAQNSTKMNYDEQWKKIDKLMKEDNLPQSALVEIDKLYKAAIVDNQHVQALKAIVYRMNCQAKLEEDPINTMFNTLEQESKTIPQPAKSVVYYLLAQLHYDYFIQNQYLVLARTNAEVKSDDRKTWDATKLLETAVRYYNLSLENPDELLRIPITDYSLVLMGNIAERQQSDLPSLYDFVAYKAFEFFSNPHSGLTQPQQTFLLNKADYFANTETFIRCKIETTDTLSFQYHALILLQKVMSFKLVDNHTDKKYILNASSLVQWDIRRLEFLKQNGRYTDNDALYEQGLKNLIKANAGQPEEVYPGYALAYLYNQQGKQWRGNKNDDYRRKRVEAYAICEDIVKKYPKHDVSIYTKALMKEIAGHSANITIKGHESPSKAILASVSYSNIDTLHLFVYEISESQYETYQNSSKSHSDQEGEIVKKGKLVYKKTQIVPSQKDHQNYRSEIKLDPLKQGFYAVFISDSDFIDPDQLKGKMRGLTYLQLSNLFLTVRNDQNKQIVSVTDRNSGKPVSEATVTIYAYDYRSNKYKHFEALQTNVNGEAIFITDDRYGNPKIVISKNNEKLIAYKGYFNQYYQGNNTNNQTIFFTDRSIYRPGQTVYYKGLAFSNSQEGERKKLLINTSFNVRFTDVNYQQIAQEKHKTNEYGTFQGSFTIPQGLLNGTMMISNGAGSVAIQVEEYKRPTFEVKFNPLKDNYTLNSKIQVTANAKALAGYSVDEAKVQYRVVRSSRYRWVRWWYPMLSAPEREITSGVLKTDAKGDFTIDFVAEAEDVKNTDLIYTYKVVADVTDINGETRSATLSVNVGNKPLVVDVSIPDKIKTDVAELPINTTNLNGDFTPADVSVTIHKLVAPKGLYRPRLWTEPDTLTILRDEFEKDFPLDMYGASVTPDKFVVDKEIWKTTFNTSETKKLNLSSLKTNPTGWYSVKIKAVDQNGVDVENTYYTRLLSDKPQPITSMNEWLTVIKDTGEPGESAEFWVAGGETESYIKYEILHKSKVVREDIIKTGTTPQRIVIPITEQHRGGFNVRFAMVQNNRLYTELNNVTVPFTNKQLDVTFTSFRDMLLPGENEKWTLRIRNKKGEKEMAEMVASLYDASLDALRPHRWDDITSFYSQYGYYVTRVETASGEDARTSSDLIWTRHFASSYTIGKPRFNFFDQSYYHALRERENTFFGSRAYNSSRNHFGDQFDEEALNESIVAGLGAKSSGVKIRGSASLSRKASAPEAKMAVADFNDKQGVAMETGGSGGVEELPQMELSEIATRQNFNETAFFYPELRTDENGEIIIEFVIPEALTRWKMVGFAHTQDLKIGTIENNLVTQKQVAISANAPRFFRENDTLVFAAKVNNVTEGELSGQAMLQLYDALTMQPVNAEIIRTQQTLPFTVKAGESTGVSWTLKIPTGIQAIGYKVTAQAGSYTDGEEKTVPVLTNSMLVTETMPFYIRGGEDKTFTFDRLKDVKSNTLRNHSLTLEYTSAPAWYAIQSIPYLMEYPYECAEQVFSRYYANSLASTIVNSSPKVKQVFDLWRTLPDSKALLSNIEKNQELKQALLEETPWVMQAHNDTERKKRVGLLFDLNKMSNELNRALNKLEKMQYSDGGFPWFDNLPASRFITQHIVTGIEHLKKMNAISESHVSRSNTMLAKSLNKLDAYIFEDYKGIIDRKDIKQQRINSTQLHYLYASSFSGHKPQNKKQLEAFDYYFNQAIEYWNEFGLYEKAMLSLVMDRYGKKDVAMKIIASLRENAQQSDAMGMYWKSNVAGYYWHQAPIETQALLIEAFNEVANDKKAVEEMKIWLLRNKQTNDWKTTKATSEACYALLMTGDSYLSNSQPLEVNIAGKPLDEVAKGSTAPEPGTGYVKTVWGGSDVSAKMAELQVKNPNPNSMAWGAMYWQYFEQLDKITHAETNLKMNKQLFLKTVTDKGVVLRPIDETNVLKVGDVVKVRMELCADRAYEYVHLKDMRAAGFEPINAISGHRYQDGLWYYESIKDASTNFFITHLNKGTYVFEYELRVSHLGSFSNGVTTFQCMYAPEFSAHSEGIRVQVKEE